MSLLRVDVIFAGENFTDMNFEQRVPIRTHIGMLFQNSALFDSMNVEDNIIFPLNLFTEMSKAEKVDRANFCLKRVNLGREKQIVSIRIIRRDEKTCGYCPRDIHAAKIFVC